MRVRKATIRGARVELYRVLQAHDGRTRGIVRIPSDHPILADIDMSSLAEANLAIEVPGGISYSAAGEYVKGIASCWFVGFVGVMSENRADEICSEIVRQLREWEGREAGDEEEDDEGGVKPSPGYYSETPETEEVVFPLVRRAA